MKLFIFSLIFFSIIIWLLPNYLFSGNDCRKLKHLKDEMLKNEENIKNLLIKKYNRNKRIIKKHDRNKRLMKSNKRELEKKKKKLKRKKYNINIIMPTIKREIVGYKYIKKTFKSLKKTFEDLKIDYKVYGFELKNNLTENEKIINDKNFEKISFNINNGFIKYFKSRK
jgi:hypothetical protein